MKQQSILLSILILSGCVSSPVVQVQAPRPVFTAPMTATALRAPATSDGVRVPAHNAQGLISGIEPLPVEPLVSQDAFWIVANDAPPLPQLAAQEKVSGGQHKAPLKKVAHKPVKPAVKYVCKPVKRSS